MIGDICRKASSGMSEPGGLGKHLLGCVSRLMLTNNGIPMLLALLIRMASFFCHDSLGHCSGEGGWWFNRHTGWIFC